MSNRNKTAIAAAALTLAAAATVASAAPITVVPGSTAGIANVTSITTRTDAGLAVSQTGVAGEGSAYSPFKPTNKYTVTYGGDIQKVLTISAGGTTYAASGLANNVVRRYIGSPTDNLWYKGTETGTTSGSTVNVQGPILSGFTQVFDANNIDVGADNLFSTQTTGTAANPVGDNTDVDRVDLLFAGGIAASTKSAFFIADRGEGTDHDAFAVAAITSLDANGNPATFGQLLEFADGTWGTTDVQARTEEEILRRDNTSTTDPLHPADHTAQPIGGVAITTAALAASSGASTIYGYALFSPDLTVTGNGSGTQLVNYTNGKVYGQADSTSKGGGIDPAATIAVLYTAVSVPEPTSAALAVAATGLLLGRRRRAAAAAR